MMVKRLMIQIEEEKCTGCGLCVPSCAEGALQIVDGKAKVVSESYCDGLGACLGHCPEDALHLLEVETVEFDGVFYEGKGELPNFESESLFKTDRPQYSGRVFYKTEVMQDANDLLFNVLLAPKVIQGLKEKGKGDIMVLVGGIILRRHVPELMKMGVHKVFFPGAPPVEIVQYIKDNCPFASFNLNLEILVH